MKMMSVFARKKGCSACSFYLNIYYGVQTIKGKTEKAVTTTSSNGGWFMLSGVELGEGKNASIKIEAEFSAKKAGQLEIWLNDLTTGKLIATIPAGVTGRITGRHSVKQ